MLQLRILGERSIAMATTRQRKAAKKNVAKAASKAKQRRTIAHLPKRTRTALGKKGAAAAKKAKGKGRA
jgi:hypothetical protein